MSYEEDQSVRWDQPVDFPAPRCDEKLWDKHYRNHPASASPAPHDTLRDENAIRVKYQEVIYAVCNIVDEALGDHGVDRCTVENIVERLHAALAAQPTTSEVPTGLEVSGSGGDEALWDTLPRCADCKEPLPGGNVPTWVRWDQPCPDGKINCLVGHGVRLCENCARPTGGAEQGSDNKERS